MKKQLFLALFLSLSLSTFLELTKHKSTPNVVTTTGRMNLTNYQIYQYSANFTIGTPAQNTTIAIDLNSNQFWIPSNNATCYSPSASTTANITAIGESLQYGTSIVAGYKGTEVIGQAHLGVSNVLMNTLFAYQEIGMNGLNACGLMGLSNDQSWKNFLEVAATAGQISDSQFGFQLKNTTNQNVYFYASSAKFPSSVNLIWFQATTSNHWIINVNGTVVGATTYSQPAGLTSALFDTSISQVLIGNNAYNGLLNDSTIKAKCSQQSGYVLCPCAGTGFPDVYFQSNGHHLHVAPADYMDPLSGSYCMLGFTGIDAADVPFIVLGDVFLKNYFTAFDKTNNKVGLSGPGVHAYEEQQ